MVLTPGVWRLQEVDGKVIRVEERPSLPYSAGTETAKIKAASGGKGMGNETKDLSTLSLIVQRIDSARNAVRKAQTAEEKQALLQSIMGTQYTPDKSIDENLRALDTLYSQAYANFDTMQKKYGKSKGVPEPKSEGSKMRSDFEEYKKKKGQGS
jgi:hypothetical protein